MKAICTFEMTWSRTFG